MPQTVKAVMVGCGGISRAWLDAIKAMPDVEMVGFVDLLEDAARARAEEYGCTDALIATDIVAALNRTQPDVVFNCTVPEAHYDVTLTALRLGYHILGEKPLADSMAHARIMVDTAEETGRIFAVIQNRRYMPGIRRLRRFLDAGVIGPVTKVDTDFYIGAHFGGFRDHMRHVLLVDMAIHTFDMARMITGADAEAVYCHEWNPSGSWYDHDASADAIFEMTGGIVYNYRGNWCAEGKNTTWEGWWRIVGEKGTVLWDGEEDFKVQVVSQTGSFFSEWADVEVPPLDPADKIGSHGGVIRDFVDAVKAGGTPETICSDNIKSLAMVFGAVESAESGQRVEIAA